MPSTPGPSQRWRCAACGNLTRFDVERRPHLREFVHLDLAGEPTVESTEVLADGLVSVACRWCRSDRVEVVDRADAAPR